MGETRDRMVAELELRGYSDHTCVTYLRIAEAFTRYYMRAPDEMGEHEVRAYLLNRRRKVKLATLAVDVAALKFLYEAVLRRPEVVAPIPFPKVPHPLPDILSGTEVLEILTAVESIKHRAILMTSYGAGLRVSEACSLHTDDIDSQRMLVHIRGAKRGRDRYVMLGQRLLLCLSRRGDTSHATATVVITRKMQERVFTSCCEASPDELAVDQILRPAASRRTWAPRPLDNRVLVNHI